MARGKRAPPKRSLMPYVWLVAGFVAAVAVVAIVVGQGDDDGVPGGRFEHLHGIGVDAADADRLIVATHTGLHAWDGSWSALGTARDDYMGFSPHPSEGGVYFVSGHPAGGGNMGFRKSTDGGATWQQVGAVGMDFHGMAVSPADPNRAWGYYAGQLWRSDDGGVSWAPISQSPPRIYSLAGGADARDTLFAATQGGVQRSADGGRTWTVLNPRADIAVATTIGDPLVLWTAGPQGVHHSTDGGGNWTRVPLDAARQDFAYVAVAATDVKVVYAASHQTGVWRSTDAGETWTLLHSPR